MASSRHHPTAKLPARILRGLAACAMIAATLLIRHAFAQTGTQHVSPDGGRKTVVLQAGLQGYAGAADSYIGADQPDANHGGEETMVVRSGGQARMLVRFDFSALPADAMVESARLELYADGGYGLLESPLAIAAYNLRRSWPEPEVTWNAAAAGRPWGVPGADDIVTDRSGVSVATATVTALGAWVLWDITNAAQGWIADPGANRGLLFVANAAGASEIRFFSRSYSGDVALRPKLTVVFKEPPKSPTPTATDTPTAVPTATATQSPTPTATPTAGPVYANSPLGVQIGEIAPTPLAWQRIAESGLRLARVRLDWQWIEQTDETPPRFQWDYYDQIAANAQATGVDLMWIVGEAPPWAATYPCGPIDRVPLDRFDRFFRAAIERYPQVHYWELVNEPDWNIAEQDLTGGCFGRYPNEYAALLKTAWQTLHDANPDAELMFGGLISENIGRWQRNHCEWQQPRPEDEYCVNFMREGGDFLDQVLNAGAAPYFDLVNVHSYYAFHPLWDQYGPSGLGKGRYYEQRLAKAGTSKPLSISEMGVRSDPDNVMDGAPATEEKQSRFLVQAFARTMSAGYRPIIWFTLRDFDVPPNFVYGYGLLHTDWTPKLSFYAAQTYARELGDAQPVSGRFFGNGFESYRFAVPGGGETEVAWTTTEVTTTASLPCSRVRVVDKGGDTVYVRDGTANDADGQADGQAGVHISPSPVYLRLCPVGDANCDGRVQVDDLQAVADAWGLHQQDAAYKAEHDQDGDGSIGLADVMITAAHQGDVCAWPP